MTGTKVMDKSKATEYVAALCHMGDGGLVPYDSECFTAANAAEAAERARKWATAAAGVITDKTWLHVTFDRATVYTEELRAP